MILSGRDSGKSPHLFRRMILYFGGGRAPIVLFDQALVSGANFVTNILIARTFGLKDYGIFALAWMAVLFANSFQWAFIVNPMMSIGPKQAADDRPFYYGAVLFHEIVFALFASMLVLIGVVLSVKYFPQWNVGRIGYPLGAATLAYLLQDFIRRYFFSTGRSYLALISDSVSYLSQLPIIFWMSRHPGVKLSSVLWVIAVTSLAGFIACIPHYKPLSLDVQSIRKVFWRHWPMSRWLAPAALMYWGAGNIFLMAAPVYYGTAAVAALRASQNIVAVAHIWFLGLDNIVPAEAAREMHRNGPQAVLRYIERVLLRWGGVTLVFAAVVALYPTFWLKLAYGAKYASDGYVLRLYAILYLMIFISGPLRAGLQAIEYTVPIFWAYTVLTIFSVILAGPFARKLGLTGVLLGMIGTQFVFQVVIGIALIMRVGRLRREFSVQTVTFADV